MAKSSSTTKKVIERLSDLIPDSRNPNSGTVRGATILENSLRKYGAGRGVLADKNGKLIAGNKTVEQAVSIGMEKAKIVHTTGDELVVVVRDDLDLDKDPRARELSVADNRAAQVGIEWNDVVLDMAASGAPMAELGFSEKDLARIKLSGEGEPEQNRVLTCPRCEAQFTKAGTLLKMGNVSNG